MSYASLKDARCWACSAAVDEACFCPSCGAIQPPAVMDAFTRLGLPQQFEQPAAAIEQAYLSRQREFHPDKFMRKPERERQLSMQQSTAVNDAYHTVKSPLKRAQALLAMQSIYVGSERDSVKPSHALLMELMGWREAISEAQQQEALAQLEQDIKQMTQQTIARISESLHAAEYGAAAQETLKLGYLQKTLDEIPAARRRIAAGHAS